MQGSELSPRAGDPVKLGLILSEFAGALVSSPNISRGIVRLGVHGLPPRRYYAYRHPASYSSRKRPE